MCRVIRDSFSPSAWCCHSSCLSSQQKWKPGHILLPCLLSALHRALVEVANASCFSHARLDLGLPRALLCRTCSPHPFSQLFSELTPASGSLFYSPGENQRNGMEFTVPKRNWRGFTHLCPYPFSSPAELPSELLNICPPVPGAPQDLKTSLGN